MCGGTGEIEHRYKCRTKLKSILGRCSLDVRLGILSKQSAKLSGRAMNAILRMLSISVRLRLRPRNQKPPRNPRRGALWEQISAYNVSLLSRNLILTLAENSSLSNLDLARFQSKQKNRLLASHQNNPLAKKYFIQKNGKTVRPTSSDVRLLNISRQDP
jgi:hypothetical protein